MVFGAMKLNLTALLISLVPTSLSHMCVWRHAQGRMIENAARWFSKTSKLLCLFYVGHDESRASQAAAPLIQQIEGMLADTSAGQHLY